MMKFTTISVTEPITAQRRQSCREPIVQQEQLAVEMPIALVYNGISHVVLMASPMDLTSLAIGFSLTEGIISSAHQIYAVDSEWTDRGIILNISIASSCFQNLKAKRRMMTGRTGCGICGLESLEQFVPDLPRITQYPEISTQQIYQALQDFEHHQPIRALTGAMHAAAWVYQGRILYTLEDLGRHNALDKLIGKLARENIDFSSGWVLVSSRASYEMVSKCSMVGIACLAAVSAPTSMAVQLADQAGMSLIAFARSERFTIYTHANYIQE